MKALSKFTPRYRAKTSEGILAPWDDFIRDDINTAQEADWVQALRNRSHAIVVEQGLPTPKLERFKYFNIPSWLKNNPIKLAKAEIVIEGGAQYVSDLSQTLRSTPGWLQEMMERTPLGEAQYGDMMLSHLANAYIRDGVVIDVPANEKIAKPINISMAGEDGMQTTQHNFVRVGEHADITIIEYHTGTGAYFNNALTHIEVAKHARVRHYRFQENAMEATCVQNTSVEVAEGANYETFTVTNGAGLSRHQVHVDLKGRDSICQLNGVNLLEGKQQGDTTITVEHQAPSCVSKQNYRNVLNGQAVCTFQGKVHVHQIAQQTDGYQKSDALLLSGEATMNTKPELEIYADDVKCSHGTTAGRMDEEALFYMKSRGIPEEKARALLVEAFVKQAMEEVSFEPVLDKTSKMIHRWLGIEDNYIDENEAAS